MTLGLVKAKGAAPPLCHTAEALTPGRCEMSNEVGAGHATAPAPALGTGPATPLQCGVLQSAVRCVGATVARSAADVAVGGCGTTPGEEPLTQSLRGGCVLFPQPI